MFDDIAKHAIEAKRKATQLPLNWSIHPIYMQEFGWFDPGVDPHGGRVTSFKRGCHSEP